MTLYKIKLWGERYENNRTRELKRLDWLPLPNRHDGESYARLMLRADGPQIFAAWILLLQVASRCGTRGTLSRDDGTPLDSESLAIRTRASKTLFEKALPALTQMGWIEAVEADATPINPDDSAIGRDIPAPPCGDPASPCLEGKGKNRREGACGTKLPAALDSPEFLKAWGNWIGHLKAKRKPPTPHARELQLAFLEKLGPRLAMVSINNSIRGNWSGLFEPDGQPPKPVVNLASLEPAKSKYEESAQ